MLPQSTALPVIKLQLWRRDILTGVMELNDDLKIMRADPTVGLIVGMPSTHLLKQPLHKCVRCFVLCASCTNACDPVIACTSSSSHVGPCAHVLAVCGITILGCLRLWLRRCHLVPA